MFILNMYPEDLTWYNIFAIWFICVQFIDPVVVPLETGEDKGEHSEPEKDDDVGITFVAHRGSETPKTQPKSGNEGKLYIP